MKRLAIIISDQLSDRKGQLNAELNRIKYLKAISDFNIDVFCFGIYEGWLTRFLRKTKKIPRPSIVNIDGISIRCFWRRFSLLDYVLEVKLHRSPVVNKNWMNKYKHIFESYDLISAHSLECGLFARYLNSVYGIPYCVTWHGSDIHRGPFENRAQMFATCEVINDAKCNFFVSHALLKISDRFANFGTKMVLYNGVNNNFTCYDSKRKQNLKESYGCEGDTKVVAFVGNLLDIKNPRLLVPIFSAIRKRYRGEIVFWVVGDGKFRAEIEEVAHRNMLDIKFWGNQSVDLMPDIMNCVDILVLPSKNEGLPLVVLEAIACGAYVVASDVGGISEIIGLDNVFKLDENFVDSISSRAVLLLNNDYIRPSLDPKFNWAKTAEDEERIYKEILYS